MESEVIGSKPVNEAQHLKRAKNNPNESKCTVCLQFITTEDRVGARPLMSRCGIGSLSQVRWQLSFSSSRQSLNMPKLSLHELQSSRGSFWWLQGNWASAWWSEEESLLAGSDGEAKHRQQICSSSQARSLGTIPERSRDQTAASQKEQRKLPPTSACRNQFTAFTFPLGDKKPQRSCSSQKGEANRTQASRIARTQRRWLRLHQGCVYSARLSPPPRRQTHLYLFGRVLLFVPDVPRFVVQHLSVVQLLDLVDPDQPVLGCECLLQVLELDVLVADLCVARPIEAGRRPEVQLGTQRRCLSANKQTCSCS